VKRFLSKFKWYRRKLGGVWLLIASYPPCGGGPFEAWQNSCDLMWFERVKEIEIYSTILMHGRRKLMSDMTARDVVKRTESKTV